MGAPVGAEVDVECGYQESGYDQDYDYLKKTISDVMSERGSGDLAYNHGDAR
jgi:hypothetical protein